MNITKIFKVLGISKWRAAWTVIRKGIPGLLSLIAEAFTNLLRKADRERLSWYADLSNRIAIFINCGIEQFVTEPGYKAAGAATVNGLNTFAKHVSDGEYTQFELSEDIEFIETCIDLWKEAAKCKGQLPQ